MRRSRALAAVSVPTIAAVDGAAFGGGMELAACCDFVIAGERARFCLPEVKLGVFPGLGGTVWIPRRIGYARALELMIIGNEIDATTAQHWSFVNRDRRGRLRGGRGHALRPSNRKGTA